METDNGDTPFVCECGQKYSTQNRLNSHKRKVHGGGLNEKDGEEIFAKIGNATRALFPDGIPAERVIEIAEVQRTMLRVLTR